MPDIRIIGHAKERAAERIPESDLPLFVEGVKKGILTGQFGGRNWALVVRRGRRVLGIAVGSRNVWKTTLSSGMQPRGDSKLYVVQI